MHCPLSKHMAVWQLIPESRFRLMKASIGMPQSQQTVVGRPIKWAQCGCFFPLFRCKPYLRGYDHFQSSAIRSQRLKTSHHVWFNEPCGISMDELLETSSHLKVFIQSKAKPGMFLAANLTAWSSCFVPSTGVSSQERFGHVMLISCGFCAFSGAFSRSLGAILLVQLAGNHCQ